jgi:hypothetical protein
MSYRPPLTTEQKYRVLNRHRRGRPKFGLLKRLKKMAIKLFVMLAVFGLIGGAAWLVTSWFNLL